jgi:hypothetical protein
VRTGDTVNWILALEDPKDTAGEFMIVFGNPFEEGAGILMTTRDLPIEPGAPVGTVYSYVVRGSFLDRTKSKIAFEIPHCPEIIIQGK